MPKYVIACVLDDAYSTYRYITIYIVFSHNLLTKTAINAIIHLLSLF